MQEIVKMPHLGETMEEGKIVSFYVKEGDYVKKGDLLFDTETDKTVLTVESYKEGFIRKIYVKEGDIAKVGDPVLLLTTSRDEPIKEEPVAEEEKSVLPEKKEVPIKEKKIEIEKGKEARILATPLAKKLAKDYGIDLSNIVHKGDKIKREDVERYIESTKESSLSYTREIIGKRMSLSKREIPHFYLTISSDMSKIKDLKDTLNRERGWSLSYTDFLLKALSFALLEFDHINAHFEEGKLKIFPYVNIGIALDVEGTLLVPVLRNIEKKSIHDISIERREVVDRAFSKKLSPSDTEGATFTISNLGPYGIDEFSAIINPPQVGILAVGKIEDSLVSIGGKIETHPTVKLTISLDHRVVDGAYGARFLSTLKNLLENPILMWE